jgi:hypothetical protein
MKFHFNIILISLSLSYKWLHYSNSLVYFYKHFLAYPLKWNGLLIITTLPTAIRKCTNYANIMVDIVPWSGMYLTHHFGQWIQFHLCKETRILLTLTPYKELTSNNEPNWVKSSSPYTDGN